MPKTVSIAIDDLALDLRNYRTVAQPREMQAIQAMISVSPSRFWALVESLLDDGYLPTENIIVFKAAGTGSQQVVKEGNRRIAALKLIHGLLPKAALTVPADIKNKIKAVTDEWKDSNRSVPCLLFGAKEAAAVDRIVTLTHGKGDKASRDAWEAIARARHNRDANQIHEAGLDLLEKYFKAGRNLTREQIDNWSGTYPISILDEAIRKLAPRLGFSGASELAKKYPKVDHRDALDAIIKEIGQRNIRFETIRDTGRDFASAYGIPIGSGEKAAPAHTASTNESASPNGAPTRQQPTNASQPSEKQTKGEPPSLNTKATDGAPAKKQIAVAINDPKAVMRTLRRFTPLGFNREKVVALKKEMLTLKIEKAPMAFCFLLRSTFEISAKCYCDDHKSNGGPTMKDSSGKDRRLVEVLKSIVVHITNDKADKEKMKALHGAITELAKEEGLLSVTSMNQLVHNQRFSIIPGDVAALFGNIYPLLEAMNS